MNRHFLEHAAREDRHAAAAAIAAGVIGPCPGFRQETSWRHARLGERSLRLTLQQFEGRDDLFL